LPTLRLSCSIAGNLCVKSNGKFGKYVTVLYLKLVQLLCTSLQRPGLKGMKLGEIKLVVCLLRSLNLLVNERKSLLSLDETTSFVQALMAFFAFNPAPALTPGLRAARQSESELSDVEQYGLLPRYV